MIPLENPVMLPLLARLAALEAENRRIRLGFLVLLVVAGAWAAMGAARTGNVELRTSRVLLQDEAGRVRGTWEAGPSGVSLNFLGETGSPTFTIFDQGGRASLAFYDPDKGVCLDLGLSRSGPVFIMRDDRRRPRLEMGLTPVGPLFAFRDSSSRKRIGLMATDEGAAVSLLDSFGKSLLGMVVATDTASIAINDGFGRIKWMAPGR